MSPAQAVTGVVDALKSQPMTLALVVMNIGLLLYLFYSGHQTQSQHSNYIHKTQEILASCIDIGDFAKVQRSLQILKGSP